jgi:hypothetical protein
MHAFKDKPVTILLGHEVEEEILLERRYHDLLFGHHTLAVPNL